MEIKKEKVVTEFTLSLNPAEYRIILDSLTSYLDSLQQTLQKDNQYNMFDNTDFQEQTIKETQQLKQQLESEYSNEWISE
ncbi:hypothetical protein [Bacillus suaedaesalsae]|uniref:Uncharacterized protein n=1 Tax=Bacillus suaedaesalsae TaxID=2810349 RepID=A0ABS2DKJ7_9BACI|nr:hypothetical protein [Bacillus suaedaesalsae]MBM6619027.1 hypothetical protein [Bacillus suaedaesalsae]